MSDESNGYESIAAEYIAGRGSRAGVGIGVGEVREWAKTVRPRGAVLDLGCGPGYPITQLLVDAGLAVHGVDASPTMVAKFQSRFPSVPVECNTAERSNFFGREFDGVIAWGLLFLLQPAAQARVISKVATALAPGGQFVFTAPPQICEWSDAMTGQRSESLGTEAYRRFLEVKRRTKEPTTITWHSSRHRIRAGIASTNAEAHRDPLAATPRATTCYADAYAEHRDCRRRDRRPMVRWPQELARSQSPDVMACARRALDRFALCKRTAPAATAESAHSTTRSRGGLVCRRRGPRVRRAAHRPGAAGTFANHMAHVESSGRVVRGDRAHRPRGVVHARPPELL
jgi:SAM-dependent methyltransferase